MPIQTTLLGPLAPEMKTYYDRRLLERALPMLVHAKFGQKRGIPLHGGKIIEFRKFATLGVATTALTEGVPPASQALSVSAITATVAQYGGVVNFSDLVSTTTIDPLLEEITDLLAEQAAETIDTLIRDQLILGTNILMGGTGNVNPADVAVGDNITMANIRRAVLILEVGRAKKIDGFYQAIVHPNVAYDIQGTTEWVQAQQFAGSQRIFDGSLGTLYGVKFWVTDLGYKANDGTTSATVYRSLFFGANAFGVVDLAAHNLMSVFKPLGSAGTADPLNQSGTMGWKIGFTTKILDDANMVRLLTAASV